MPAESVICTIVEVVCSHKALLGRETKVVNLQEWLAFFNCALSGGVEDLVVDTHRVALSLDYLINEGSLQLSLEALSL